ncbi:hypothetical protein RCL1_002569 [Eukaryota sp. TZLM3-RCL]
MFDVNVLTHVLDHCILSRRVLMKQVSSNFATFITPYLAAKTHFDFSRDIVSVKRVHDVISTLNGVSSLEFGICPASFFHLDCYNPITKHCYTDPIFANESLEFAFCSDDVTEFNQLVEELNVDIHLLCTLVGKPKELLNSLLKSTHSGPSFACTRLFINVPSLQHLYVKSLLELVPNVQEVHICGTALNDAIPFGEVLRALSSVELQKLAFCEPLNNVQLSELHLLSNFPSLTSLQVLSRSCDLFEPTYLSENIWHMLHELSCSDPAPRTLESLSSFTNSLQVLGVENGIVSEFPRSVKKVCLSLARPNTNIKFSESEQWEHLILGNGPFPFLANLPQFLVSLVLVKPRLLNHQLVELAGALPHLMNFNLQEDQDHQSGSLAPGLLVLLSLTRLRSLLLRNCNLAQPSEEPSTPFEFKNLQQIKLTTCSNLKWFLHHLISLSPNLLDLELNNCKSDPLNLSTMVQLTYLQLKRLVVKGSGLIRNEPDYVSRVEEISKKAVKILVEM